MLIIGCDFHPGFRQVAIVDTSTGEIEEQRSLAGLIHGIDDAILASIQKCTGAEAWSSPRPASF